MNDAMTRTGLYTTTFGEGPRSLLAIHCTLAHSGAWKSLAREMTGEARFVAFDMPSHGRSPDWDGASDYYAEGFRHAAALLEDGMDVIGHSFGAVVALRAAALAPEKVRSLTLIEPVFFAAALKRAPDIVAAHDAEAKPFHDAFWEGDHERSARMFNRMWANGTRWDDLPDVARAAMVRAIPVVPACATAIYDDSEGLLAPGALDALTMPVRLLRGTASHPVMTPVLEGLAAHLPNARIEVIDGAGHMLPISHAPETAAVLRQLFAES